MTSPFDRELGREKIAILGGGMASLSAAFALSDTPALRERYQLTVYQEGWLLGGKGASVRNRDERERIQEHGLHVWLGYYENAFTLLNRCYAELGRPADAPLATLRDAFLKHSALVVEERSSKGWQHWSVTMPQTDDWPGDGRELPTVVEGLRASVRQVSHYAQEWFKGSRGRDAAIDSETSRLRRLLASALRWGSPFMVARTARVLSDGLKRILGRLWTVARGHIEVDAELRRLWVVLEFFGVCLAGAVREGLFNENPDLEALDAIEFSDWLRKQGASDLTLASGLVRAFYHLAFCDGDGAGTGLALLGMVRMFTCYRGSIFYKMRAGMGETVFAPMYEVLRKRGVKFEFFHRVRALELSADKQRLQRVVIGRQATVRTGTYEPLIDVGGLPCWPEQPLHEQLVEGDALAPLGASVASFWSQWPDVETRTLEHGKDFDRVLLGISIAALPYIAPELIAASPRWQRMVQHVKTVRTTSVQLWLTEPVGALGTNGAAPVVGAYQVPLETWADMTHLLPVEGFTKADGVKGALYACGQLGHGDDVIPDDDPHERDLAELKAVTREFLRRQLPHLWPAAAGPDGDFRWSALFDAKAREGAARLDGNYLRVNSNPSDRYVLSVAGSQKHRLAANEAGFEGLVLTGDWTRTGYDLGCIEAATMSGLLAARALGADVRVFGEVPSAPTASRSTLPRYIDRPGELALRAPYAMEQVWMSGLVLSAQRSALSALLDRYLNEPARGHVRYVAAAPFVVLAAAFSERAYSQDPAHRRFGTMPETDVAFWVPAWATRPGSGRLVPPRLVWFMPHVFVTTGAASAAGRELYGFPKSVVEVSMRRSGNSLEHVLVTGEVIPRHGPDAVGQRGRILEITRATNERGTLSSLTQGLQSLLTKAPFIRKQATEPVTLAFLKQFRDVEHTDRACYQAIVEADATVSALRGFGPMSGAFDVAWDDHASHPFAAELGLTPGGQRAVAATWVDFDFVMQLGREVFRAGAADDS